MWVRLTIFKASAWGICKKVKQHFFTLICPCQQKTTTAKAGKGLLSDSTGKPGTNSSIKGIASLL
jgi:hypothetical protein